jgi:PAS domain S-box-containing protein
MSGPAPDSGWAGLFEATFNRSQNPMALTDDNRRLLQVNAALARLLGLPPSQIVGRYTYDFVSDGPLLSREEWHLALQRGVVTGAAEVERADGETMLIQFGVHPEAVTGDGLVLFVALAVSRWGRHFRREAAEPTGELSKREREVVGMVALGATSEEIADALDISTNTARKHVTKAMRKLGARSRAHLVAKVVAEQRP